MRRRSIWNSVLQEVVWNCPGRTAKNWIVIRKAAPFSSNLTGQNRRRGKNGRTDRNGAKRSLFGERVGAEPLRELVSQRVQVAGVGRGKSLFFAGYGVGNHHPPGMEREPVQ